MKEMSATDVARKFSEVLDAIEHRHQSFVVTRGGAPSPPSARSQLREAVP